jgi:hypothetical protein
MIKIVHDDYESIYIKILGEETKDVTTKFANTIKLS